MPDDDAMQSYFVHQLHWTDYPDDFEEVWADQPGRFPNTYFDPIKGADLFNRYLDELEHAETLGFDGVCINEQHGNIFAGMVPSPNIVAAMLARRTERLKLVLLGNCLPLRKNPLRVAEEVAMLDVVTRGRVVSGFVRGAGSEYFCANVNPVHSRELFYEAHDLIRRAWTEPGLFDFDGRHYRFRAVNLWPRPYTKPHPPVWIPSAGSSETVRFAAEHRYPFVVILGPIENTRRLFDAYRAVAEDELGYSASPRQLGYAPRIYVADSDEQAREEAAQHDAFIQQTWFRIPTHLVLPAGYVTEVSRRQFLETRFDEKGESAGLTIAGTPSTVLDQLVADYDALGGFGFVIASAAPGNGTHEQTIRTMTLFQREVFPALREYHRDAMRSKPGRA
jgi:alkanesulfonate monooxygenase SsuD/methylene tetrahydromethanopterin reductase-like flavin-dependent oxidoreductase (luciferase family)